MRPHFVIAARGFSPLLLALTLGACSIFEGGGDAIVFDTALGPLTETQIDALPGGMIGDEDGQRHRGDQKGEDLTDERPGGGQ